jgi:membrane-associated phospholipid phosphatase
MVQAAIIALIISTIYKAFTGRVPPEPFTSPGEVDFSLDFRFGLLNGGILEGWPSGHTMIAFAMAVALRLFLPERRWIGLFCLVYAGYVGLGVSATIHWFSDAVAGGLIGVAIGLTVGKAFHARSEDHRSDSGRVSGQNQWIGDDL